MARHAIKRVITNKRGQKQTVYRYEDIPGRPSKHGFRYIGRPRKAQRVLKKRVRLWEPISEPPEEKDAIEYIKFAKAYDYNKKTWEFLEMRVRKKIPKGDDPTDHYPIPELWQRVIEKAAGENPRLVGLQALDWNFWRPSDAATARQAAVLGQPLEKAGIRRVKKGPYNIWSLLWFPSIQRLVEGILWKGRL